jgi:hypothetical protein
MAVLGFVFAAPLLLWGAAAAAAPVVIHLLMKTRAKQVVFPAMRFVVKSRAGSAGKMRLKHLLLLLVRMLAILLLASALAWPSCQNQSALEPVAAVFAFDNSASMEYKTDGVTRLELAKRRAAEIAATLPPESEIAVIDPDRLGRAVVWQAVPVGEEAFSAVKPSASARSVAALLTGGMEALRGHRHTRRVLYLFNDRTVNSWRDPVPTDLGRAEGASLVLVDCSPAADAKPVSGTPDANYAVLSVRPERDPVPAGEAMPVIVEVRAGANRNPVKVALAIDGETGAPQSPELRFDPVPKATADAGTPGYTVAPIRFTKAGLPAGIHTARVLLEGDDPLAPDNTAYFNFAVSRPFRVVFVYDSALGGPAEGAPHHWLANAVQPSAAAAVNRRADMVRRHVSEPWANDLEAAALLVLLNTGPLSPEQWTAVDRFVRGGGRLWFLFGDRTAAGHFDSATARGLMPAAMKEPRIPRPPAGLAAAHPVAPTLSAFGTGGAGDLSVLEVSKFWTVAQADKNSDEIWGLLRTGGTSSPGILHRKVERGRVLLWTFGPQRSWSNMQEALKEEWIVLVFETVTELMSRTAGRNDHFKLGEPVRWQLSERLAGKDVVWGKVGAGSVLGRRFAVDATGLADFGIPEEPGNYRVQLPTLTDTPEEAAFSVNIDPEETKILPLTGEALRAKLPEDLRRRTTLIAGRPAPVPEGAPPGEGEGDELPPAEEPFAGYLALVLLLVLVLESFFSNRFYKEEK